MFQLLTGTSPTGLQLWIRVVVAIPSTYCGMDGVCESVPRGGRQCQTSSSADTVAAVQIMEQLAL